VNAPVLPGMTSRGGTRSQNSRLAGYFAGGV
jgi:hypothetical protein